ncbi:dihydroorotate dehydrogenase [Brevibacillus borstelensis]|uniref:dihydroorotate dehydrogenase n=1 Tax=Brevibacillus borstelensis TaxID=45462 RepID=UPI0030BEDF08
MPDWSYHTMFRPLLFRLPAEQARRLTLNAIGTLAKCPGGPFLIQMMGHMEPPAELSSQHWGISFPAPLGLGAGLDPDTRALCALSQFGFGYVELGPVTRDPVDDFGNIERLLPDETISYLSPLANRGIKQLVKQLERCGRLSLPLACRLSFAPGSSPREAARERLEMIERLSPYCRFFTLDTRQQTWENEWDEDEWEIHLAMLAEATDVPLLLVLTPDLSQDMSEHLLLPALRAGIAGVMVAGGIAASAACDRASGSMPMDTEKERENELATGRLTGGMTKHASLQMVQWIRKKHPELVIIGSGGVIEPGDALDFYQAGADFVQLHSGLVYSGPGLPKRINEAVWQKNHSLHTGKAPIDRHSFQSNTSTGPSTQSPRRFFGWFPGLLLGSGMVAGGLLALLVALTSVVLPYDEAFLGMKASELQALNPQILPFMSHDRVSLAGTMISIGVIYCQLCRFGLRQKLHWAKQVLLVSGVIGFLSFFLYIGYGYFDILHAVLSLLLFPFFLLAVKQPANNQLAPLPAQVKNDRDWRRSLWGQFFFVIIGCGLAGAGLIISIIGITNVFVPQDLVFLCASPEVLQTYNEKLIPVIAHDRAGFGGALFSVGIAVLLISLWGFRQGESWVWWTLFLGGLPGFAAGIGIHLAVGYTDSLHLLPAYAAVLLFLTALMMTYPYFCLRKTD